jgi:transcriptional regulator, spx/mgsR family
LCQSCVNDTLKQLYRNLIQVTLIFASRFCDRKERKNMNTFICYDRCSTCKKAEDFLKKKGISFQKRPIKEENPTAEEIHQFRARSGLPLKRFFNTSGMLYKEMGLKEKLESMSEEEQEKLLATDGMLVKRPIFLYGDKVLVGFKEKEWEEAL